MNSLNASGFTLSVLATVIISSMPYLGPDFYDFCSEFQNCGLYEHLHNLHLKMYPWDLNVKLHLEALSLQLNRCHNAVCLLIVPSNSALADSLAYSAAFTPLWAASPLLVVIPT
jgi:hypothetical protein